MSLLRLARPRLLSRCPHFKPSPLRTFTLSTPFRTEASPTPTSIDPKTHIQSELKAALRAKDTPRLNVLRSVLASITNASKTSSPVNTPSQLYTLLSKQISASQKAIEEFAQAKRDDLVEKERKQVEILEGYRDGIESLKSEDIDGILEKINEEIADKGAKFGEVMKEVQKVIAGRPHDSQYLVEKIKSLVSGKS